MENLTQQKAMRDLPAANSKATLLRLSRYMIEYRGLFVVMVLTMVVGIACGLAIPLIVESAMNSISIRSVIAVDLSRLVASVSIFVAVALCSTACGLVQERIAARITLNMALRLRNDALASLMDTTVASFDSMRRGDLMSRIMNDAELAAGAFSQSFRGLFSAGLSAVGCAIIMLLKCTPLALVSVGTAIIAVLTMGALSRFVLPIYTQQQSALGILNAHVEESLNSHQTCVAGGRIPENRRRMTALSHNYYTQRLKACQLEYLMGPLMQILGNLNFLATVVFGVNQIAAGILSIGTMQAFVMYSKQFMEPLSALSDQFVRTQNAIASAERVFSVIDMPPEVAEVTYFASKNVTSSADDESDGEFSPAYTSIIQLQNVGFSYLRNRSILKNVSLSVAKGERLALVGRTGEGKTTLTSLLLLFYPNYQGRILVNGSDIRAIGCKSLRDQISVVSQDPQMIEGTILENMTYGCGKVSREQVEATAHDLAIDGLLAQLPNGLDTELRGMDDHMSQGELQLICLARAMLRHSPILVLDEATSSLDPSTEELVREGMRTATRGRTCIIIAHRLSTIIDADHIAVLDDGRIAEYGTHRSLMALNGLYSKLYQTQFLGKEI